MIIAVGIAGVCTAGQAHLQARVQVSVQPLHDEQHSDARAASVGVIDHRPVQVDEPLVFRQSPEPKRQKEQEDSHVYSPTTTKAACAHQQ